MKPWKIGDRVRVYGYGSFGSTNWEVDGTVISCGHESHEAIEVKLDDGRVWLCHPKQLRRLKPKKKAFNPPKEFWMNIYPNDSIVVSNYTSREAADRGCMTGRLACCKYVLAEGES